MKILAIADTHADTNLVKKIANTAKKEKVDLVIMAGDLTWFDEEQKDLVGPIAEHSEVLIIHGNHETHETAKNFEKVYKNVKQIHKTNVIKNEIGFFGSGTTDWGFYEDAEVVYEEIKEAHNGLEKITKKILVSHCPPEGSAIEMLGFPGSRGVRKAIDEFKPDFMICGHIHEGGGLIEKIGKTKVINASRTPTIFEI